MHGFARGTVLVLDAFTRVMYASHAVSRSCDMNSSKEVLIKQFGPNYAAFGPTCGA